METAAPPESRTYCCFDFRLRSAIPLPELHMADPGGENTPIVDIRTGRVPATLPGGREVTPQLQAAGDDVLLTIAGAGRYLIRGRGEIIVDAEPEATDLTVRLFLLGSALGVLGHLRGLLLLHANAIVAGGVAGDGAFAFAGESGMGKSTLAAHFERAGYRVLCDDVCAITIDGDGQPIAWPGLPRLKLWGDAAKAFGHEPAALDIVIDGTDKYQVPMSVRHAARPVPFRRLYILSRAEPGGGGITRLRGGEAMRAILANTYRGFCVAPLGLGERHFRDSTALSSRIGVYAAARVWGYDVFAEEAARLEHHLAVPD